MSEWTKVISKQRSMYYWFNTKTKETRWEDEPRLEDSDYITHFLEWIHCVMLSEVSQSLNTAFRDASATRYHCKQELYDLNPYILHDDDVMTTDTQPADKLSPSYDIDETFQLDKTTMCMLGSPNPVLSKSLQSTFFMGIPSTFICMNGTLSDTNFIFPSPHMQHVDLKNCPRKPHINILYLPFGLHEYMESEFTLRTLMHFAYSSIYTGGYLIGMTLNPTFIHDILHGQDQYGRYWKSSHAKTRSLSQKIWSTHTHLVSYGSFNDLLIRYGTSGRSRGWDTTTFPAMAKEYKFEIVEWSTLSNFYYKHANRYMKEFKTHVSYKLSTPTDWISLDMYQVFICRKL